MGKVDRSGSEQSDRPETAGPTRFTAESLGALLDVLRILHARDQGGSAAETAATPE
jgi:hypothetical protein